MLSSLMVAGCGTIRHTAKWEYKTLPDASDSTLNQMVEQGWSVVDFTAYSFGSGGHATYLLKRPKQ